MSTVKVDSVQGSFLPLPVIKHANDVQQYAASAGQTVFTVTKFDNSNKIKVIANVGGTWTDVAASWTGTNTVTTTGITFTANQVVHIFNVGVLATDVMVFDTNTSTWVTLDALVSSLNTSLNDMTARMHAVALSF